MRTIEELTDREILALAIALEERDGRLYHDFAERLQADYPSSADVLRRMADEEATHRDRLLSGYRERFGDELPQVKPGDIKGFQDQRPPVLRRGPDSIREMAAAMEEQTRAFYEKAAGRTTDAGVRQLLNSLADEERRHSAYAADLNREHAATAQVSEAETERRRFVLQIVQPGLAGLMDGSVSTLAPLFAAAFATGDSMDAFRVGMAASVGAGISMGFAEALSDDGALTGRGKPLLRGVVCGLMTTAGGIGHTLPYLISDFRVATGVAIVVVVFELVAISLIRNKYMDTPLLSAAFQVIVGGILVFLAGYLIGVA
ncbi:MAG TPA: ferritin family protein [Tepidisphaeraceae bacterium]|jgi:rubrerythrin